MVDEFETTGGIDPEAFGTSLFESPDTPKPDEQANSLATPVVSGDSPAPAPVAAPAAAAEPTPEPWEALPKSWKRDMEAHWKAAPAEVRKYAHERESQVTQGISSYRQAADSWSKVMAPFQAIMQEYPNANPQEILATLAANHVQMVRSSPEQRREHALALARGYGVDFATATAVVNAQASDPAAAKPNEGFSPAQIAALNQMLSPVVETVSRTAAAEEKRIKAAAESEVDAFFSDPKNEFVNDVADDILLIMRNGQAQSLPEAYELAVLRNPSVKPRYIASLTPKPPAPPAPKAKLPNVKSSATPASLSKPGSMEETMAGVISKHYS